jgi:hypothetical protein
MRNSDLSNVPRTISVSGVLPDPSQHKPYRIRPDAACAHTYCAPIPENRVIATQQTCVHDAICFFVAFSLTDFVTCGFASFFLTLATSAKNAASDFFSLGTFHRSLIAS